jgi:hypothetical protein
MPITNPSFETATALVTPWEATGWTYASAAACRLAGFGEYEDPLELFTWGGFSVYTSTFLFAVFGPGINMYEPFSWGNFIEDWAPGWIVSFLDSMEWYTFSDVFVPGIFFGYDAFDWSVFSDVFVPGFVGMFDAGTEQYEEFETW